MLCFSGVFTSSQFTDKILQGPGPVIMLFFFFSFSISGNKI